MASVLPPAPAQKSHTISPRRAPSSSASSWLPSSCTSRLPSTNSGWRLIAGWSLKRMPHGEYGVGSTASPSSRNCASTVSRSALYAFTRTSIGAGCCRARPSTRMSASLITGCSFSTTHSGSSAATASGRSSAAHAARLDQPGDDQGARIGRRHHHRQIAIAAQHAEHGFGHERALARAELLVVTKKRRQFGVGRTLEVQHPIERLGGKLQ